MSSPREPLVAGNWKMHLVRAEAVALCRALATPPLPARPEVALFPSFPLLDAVAHELQGTGIGLGAQDLRAEPAGAFTGDVSAAQLVDVGCGWVLCGHSERRRDHAEGDELVAKKATAALAAGLSPIVCVGETRAERHAGQAFEVLARQVERLPIDPRLVVAYEPVWAIGTGENASAGTASDAQGFLRARFARRAGTAFAEALRILYGGSVTPENAPELAAAEDVDGFLVGGASLDPTRFRAIITAFAAP